MNKKILNIMMNAKNVKKDIILLMERNVKNVLQVQLLQMKVLHHVQNVMLVMELMIRELNVRNVHLDIMLHQKEVDVVNVQMEQHLE